MVKQKSHMSLELHNKRNRIFIFGWNIGKSIGSLKKRRSPVSSKLIVSVGNMSVQERTLHSSNHFMGSLKDSFWHWRDCLRNSLPRWAHLNTGMRILQILDFIQNIILHKKSNVINTNSDLPVNDLSLSSSQFLILNWIWMVL